MNTLFDSVVSTKLKSSQAFKDLYSIWEKGGSLTSLQGVHGSLLAVLIARLRARYRKPAVVVFPTEKEAEQFARDCESFSIETELFPWWGSAPYKPLPQNSATFGSRVRLLTELQSGFEGVVVCSLRAFLSKLPPPSLIKANSIFLKKRQSVRIEAMCERLVASGYMRVGRVSVPGEFALRGEILDIWMPGDDSALRLGLAFDEIEDIRRFDPLTQSSGKHEESACIHPFSEFLWTSEQIARTRSQLDQLPETTKKKAEDKDALAESLTRGEPGSEIWYPLGLEEPGSLVDYVPGDTLYFFPELERLYAAAEGFEREYLASWRKNRVNTVLLPRPERLIWDLAQLQARIRRLVYLPILDAGASRTGSQAAGESIQALFTHERFRHEGEFDTQAPAHDEGQEGSEADNERHQLPILKPEVQIKFHSEAGRSFFGNIEFLKEEIAAALKAGYDIFVFAEAEAQTERIRTLLQDLDVKVLAQELSTGFTLPDLKLLVIEEHEIFGRRRRIPQSVKKLHGQAIDSFVELDPGDFVVHVHHGIGKFIGIKRINAGNMERDYIELEYADREFVFVPIEQVNLVQRYIGNQGSDPRLDAIGGKSWEKRKSAVRKSVEDIAGRLIELYGKRKKARGFAFPKDNEWQIQFEASFPFEETEDQVKCIKDVKEDMERPVPMDRLVCGDVGYGKTEIALRAAFKAVSAGKQVAILAPTTILAEQHFENLEERLVGFPVHVAMLSRFVQPKDQKKAMAGLVDGSIDIVIGTHRILQKDVNFKDLGLIVIDEEQRFGVKDKERLKELKHSVDCLTLTATPIPRTLHMSLLKIRDMSVLQTPPFNRRPIETHVYAYDDQIVAEAIRREITRGGQVFWLHNRVESLEATVGKIQTLVPEILVENAHGQMDPSELEDIMHRFIHGGFHVLVATTIIENGINIPNVNTIIIDRADLYGVSQLYQLRGRVGRSERMAWAYLLYPGERALSEIAMKRLQIISDHTELGSGFKIALKDLEVRGAGNLLGAEQSGEIVSVGFDMYLKLLDEAIRRLSEGENSSGDSEEIYLDLEYSGYIPDTYVKESSEKMELYKKIASIQTPDQLESVFAEISDRFGPPPETVMSLMSLAELRVLCRKMKISSLKERKGVLEVEFAKVNAININKAMELIRTSSGKVKPHPSQPNILRMDTGNIGLQEKSEFIRDRLMRLL